MRTVNNFSHYVEAAVVTVIGLVALAGIIRFVVLSI